MDAVEKLAVFGENGRRPVSRADVDGFPIPWARRKRL